jgi:soluble lytic murein transglycosylase-like protein
MIRFLLSGVAIASSLTFAVPAFAEPDVHGFLNAATPEQREDIREEVKDVQEAETPKERREEKAELKEEIREVRKEVQKEEIREERKEALEERKDALKEGRASTDKSSSGNSLQALVAKYAEANGVPAQVGHGVVMVESRYNPRATGAGTYIGLMQISYRTAQGIGYAGSREGLYDPATNLQYGMKYLGEAYRLSGGNLCGAVSKYQGGHGVSGVTKAGAVYCGKVKNYMAKAAPAERTVVAENKL